MPALPAPERGMSRRLDGGSQERRCRLCRRRSGPVSDLALRGRPRSARARTRRWPARLRPRTLDEFVGQEHVLGEGRLCGGAIAEDRVGSVIFCGPPGAARRRSPGSSPRRRARRSRSLGGRGVGRRRARSACARRERLAAPGSGRSSSWTRSTASTRPSRTRCCRRSRTGSYADRGDDREPSSRSTPRCSAACQLYELEPLDEDDLDA